MKEIIRTCVVSRKQYNRNELFRVVKDKNNNVSLDLTYKMEGFGSYILKDRDVIIKGKKNNSLNKKLRVFVPSDVYELMLDELVGDKDE